MSFRKICYALSLIVLVYLASVWFLWLVVAPLVGDELWNQLDLGFIDLGAPLNVVGIDFRSGMPDDMAVVEMVQTLGLDSEMDEVLQALGIGSWTEYKAKAEKADADKKRKQAKQTSGLPSTAGTGSTSASPDSVPENPVDPRVANGNDPGSHPSIIKFSDHFDPLDDIGSREYGATGPAGPVEYDTATVSAGGEGSAELYAYEQRRYSLILREALQAMRGRRYDTAKKLFLRCSDERKKPMELIGPGTGLVRSSSSNDPSDVMGEKQFRTGVQPNPDYTETPNSQSIYDPYCVNKVGELHLAGTLFPKNYYRAIEMFVEAAALGNEEAQYNLGILFAAAVEDDPHYAILHRTVMRGHGMEPGYGGEGAAGDALDGQGSGADQNGLVPAGYQAQPVANSEALSILYLYAASTAGHPGALMAMAHRHDQGLGVPKICSTAALNYIEVAKSITEIYSSGMPQAVELIRLNLDYKKNKKMMTASEISLFTQIARQGDVAVAAAIGKRYLLGIDGFQQNYAKAYEYLRMSIENGDKEGALAGGSGGGHGGSLGLLGYMHALGLGVDRNLVKAHEYFVSASLEGDALGKNGLGFIYFHGTGSQDRDLKQAFHYFNESAIGGSADGMFNLASVYLTGVGVEQSFQKAVLWYTQALDRGHTPAAYSLAIMHLNGVGTVRDCSIATNLLKRVSERGAWVSSRLQDAYAYAQTVDYDASSDSASSSNLIMKALNWISFGLIPDASYQNSAISGEQYQYVSGAQGEFDSEAGGEAPSSSENQYDPSAEPASNTELGDNLEGIDASSGKVYDPIVSPDMAALLFLQLSEAGHEVAQTNLAHLYDQNQASLISSHPAFRRFYAQRFYELSADQGSASSELRLGDYAYNGWGRRMASANAVNGTDDANPNSMVTNIEVDDDMVTAEELDMYQRMGVNVSTYRRAEEIAHETGGLHIPSERHGGKTAYETMPKNYIGGKFGGAFGEMAAQAEAHNKLKEPNEEILLRSAEARQEWNKTEERSGNVNAAVGGGGVNTGADGTSTEGADQQPFINEPPADAFEHLFHTHPEEIVAKTSEAPDLETAAAHYWKVSQMSISGEWTQQFVARASFNLGMMYQFGLGAAPDLNLARKLYKRCIEVDPGTVQTPIHLVLFGLSLHKELLLWMKVDWIAVRKEVLTDARFHICFLSIIGFILLLKLRFSASDRRDQLLQEIRRRRDLWRGVEKLLMFEYKKHEELHAKSADKGTASDKDGKPISLGRAEAGAMTPAGTGSKRAFDVNSTSKGSIDFNFSEYDEDDRSPVPVPKELDTGNEKYDPFSKSPVVANGSSGTAAATGGSGASSSASRPVDASSAPPVKRTDSRPVVPVHAENAASPNTAAAAKKVREAAPKQLAGGSSGNLGSASAGSIGERGAGENKTQVASAGEGSSGETKPQLPGSPAGAAGYQLGGSSGGLSQGRLVEEPEELN